ncbi:MAG TPA: hypothetical protein VMB78_07150 [Dissulfurispiraceae bacterium]|nr:hypothetical protein [Dissulfurispiraceae bacterium]
MKTGFIPIDLFNISSETVRKFHREKGFDKLGARIETARNLEVIGRFPEAMELLNKANRYFRVRKWCFFGSIGIICFTFLIPWWSLGALVTIFIADKVLANREKDGWKSLASMLLSLEMLANDFSDWGKSYPAERAEALHILKDNPELPATPWIDYYLPGQTG